MAISLKQAAVVGSYLIGQRLKGNKRFPLVLMLEPLFRCNLACSGCGKIQHPVDVLRRHLSPEQCFKAVEECGAPVVAIPGGEPLLHPQIGEIVTGLVERKKFVYLCTNAIRLEANLDKFTPSSYFSFSVHLDGLQAEHDKAVDRAGIFEIAVKAIKAAKARGFRVTTNTTIFKDADPKRVQEFFDFATEELKVDGMMISPGYPYEKAPDQAHFLERDQTKALFREIMAPYKAGTKKWQFNASPFFIDFLVGEKEYECTPWGMPSYSLFGWQKPCYLLGEGYAPTWKAYLEETPWEQFGHNSGNPKCADCMVHSGFEMTAALDAMRPQNMIASLKSVLAK
ncbi:MAG: adenosyl-hopene transferase HpnH [Candidatus Velthaea sp.]